MSSPAATELFMGSDVLSMDELFLYHQINDLRLANGLVSLKPSLDLSIIAGQHAGDFDQNVGYRTWASQAPAQRAVPTLHHWSDGSNFLTGLLDVARAFNLSLPNVGLAENAQGLLAAFVSDNVMQSWLDNPAARANLFSSAWNAVGIGIHGDLVYASFGAYGGHVDITKTVRIVGTQGADTVRTTPWADMIDAKEGHDSFVALSDGDRLDGGNGLDSAVFTLNQADYLLQRVQEEDGDWLLVQGGGINVRLRNIEYLSFKDGVIDGSAWGLRSTLVAFDEAYYRAHNPDVADAIKAGWVASGFQHFHEHGESEGRNPSAFFDTSYYLANNPDIATAVAAGTISSAFDHFLLFGQFEGRNPNPYFEADAYLAMNPDLVEALQAGVIHSALDHYLSFGRYEGRLATDDFDAAYYLEHNADVAAAVAAGAYASPLDHYRLIGQIEGRAPFDGYPG
jgi:hypothetical protein